MLAWLWQWIVLPLIIMCGVFYMPIIISMIPFFGTIINGGVIIFIFINMDMVDLPLLGISPILIIFLLLAFLDCVIELFYTGKYKLYNYKDDDFRVGKSFLGVMAPMIGVLIYYYTAPDYNWVENILSNSAILLSLFIVPRAVFAVIEIYAIRKIYPKASEIIKSGEWFKVAENSSAYYKRYIKLQQNGGFVISNEDTIKKEHEIGIGKIDKKYPKNFILKAVMLIRDTEAQELRSIETKISYISKSSYEKFREYIEIILKESGPLSPRTLIEQKLPDKSNNWLSFGADFFMIQALASAVKDGRIEDMDISDSPLVNHVYRHTESQVSMKVINANNDPRLALDD